MFLDLVNTALDTATQWLSLRAVYCVRPVAYLLTMTDGSMLPAVAASLAPLLAPRGARGEDDAAETSRSQLPDTVRSSDRQPDTAHTDNSPQSPPDVNLRSNAGAADGAPVNPAYPDIDIQRDSGSVAQYHGERDQSFPNIDHHPGPFSFIHASIAKLPSQLRLVRNNKCLNR